MALTEEQKERMRKNRERALEIQRKRREEQEKIAKEEGVAINGKRAGEDGETADGNKRMKLDENRKEGKKELIDEESDDDLEAFEEGASELVAKGEAKKMYCLPEGSLAVCEVVEKDNPRNKGWSKMKLYYRVELRRRARKRHGGKQGLIEERRKREEDRFRNDIEKTKNIFKK